MESFNNVVYLYYISFFNLCCKSNGSCEYRNVYQSFVH